MERSIERRDFVGCLGQVKVEAIGKVNPSILGKTTSLK